MSHYGGRYRGIDLADLEVAPYRKHTPESSSEL